MRSKFQDVWCEVVKGIGRKVYLAWSTQGSLPAFVIRPPPSAGKQVLITSRSGSVQKIMNTVDNRCWQQQRSCDEHISVQALPGVTAVKSKVFWRQELGEFGTKLLCSDLYYLSVWSLRQIPQKYSPQQRLQAEGKMKEKRGEKGNFSFFCPASMVPACQLWPSWLWKPKCATMFDIYEKLGTSAEESTTEGSRRLDQ